LRFKSLIMSKDEIFEKRLFIFSELKFVNNSISKNLFTVSCDIHFIPLILESVAFAIFTNLSFSKILHP